MRYVLGRTTTLGVADQKFGVSGRALYRDNLKYIDYRSDDGEQWQLLFDLAADPFEQRDLSAIPAYQDRLKQCRAALIEWCHQYDDRHAEKLID